MKKEKTRMKSETLDTVERERERERERSSLEEKKNNNFSSKFLNKKSGITMVALVVTIVVLLILASISIQGITRTGIFRAAEDTKLEHKRAAIATNLQTKLKINQTEQIRGTDEEVVRATYEDVKNDLEEIKKAGGKDIEVSEVTSEEKDGKTEWFFEVKVDGDVYKVGLDGSDYLGKEDELAPLIEIKKATATTNTITATVTTRRNEGGKIEYYIKEKGSQKFDLAGTTDQNTFKYTKLKQEKTYVIEAVAINTNGKKKVSKEYEIKTSLVPKIDSNEIKFASVPNEWTNKSVEVTATLTVDGQNFTLTTSKNSTSGWIASNRQIFTENGTMYAALTDGNNYGIAASHEVTNIDTTKPIVKSLSVTTNTIKITATDEASGIYSYAISESETMPKTFTKLDNSTQVFNTVVENLKQSTQYYVWVKDVAGNISEVASTKTGTVPKLTDANTTITKSPNDWTTQEVTATVTTTEKNYALQTKKDNGKWQTTNTQKFTENGTIYARLWDGTNAGEEIYKPITNIDKTAPTATNIEIKNVTPAGYDVYVYGVKDNGSGVNRVQFPTWTEAKGQDDIQPNWQTGASSKGTKQADGTTWVYHVNITDHKTEAGEYNTHIYAYDNLENGKCIGTQKVTIPMVKITYDENYVKDGTTNKQTVEKVYNTELGTLGTPTRTGYTFAGWFTEATGGTQISSTTKTPVTDTTYYAHWNANPLNFANQTISKTFSTSEQKADITGASNGTGNYTYAEKTEKNSAQKDTNYISINGTTITIAANTPADTYTYVIVATDNNSKVTKEATYTIKIERAKTANAGASDKTYNGTNQTGVTGTNVTWTGTTSAIDAGTYTANATPDANYAWSDGTTNAKAITWKMNPKSISVTWGTTTTFTYNGQPQAPTVSATSGITGETINVTRTTGTNAGSYTSTASISSVTGGRARKENYTLTGNTKAFTINKASVATPANIAVSTAGIVTWSGATNATSYEISINGSNWTAATSGVNYLRTIIGATGNRTVYVRATNKDSNNYATPSGNTTKAVAVYAVTINSNSTTMGTVDTASYNVISGATYTTSGNKLTIKGITTGTTTSDLKTITATANRGYSFSKWSATSGTITAATTITATFTANTYTISYNGNGATGGSTASHTVTYDQIAAIATNGFTRTGYTFAGWTTKTDGSDDGYNWTNWKGTWKYVDGQYGIANGKLQLYARWTINQYTFDLNYNVDGNWYYSGYNNTGSQRIYTGLKTNGVDRGYVSDYGGTFNYGTSWEIYGLKIDGQVVNYKSSGTLGTSNPLNIYLKTLVVNKNITAGGNVSLSDIPAINGTTYTANSNVVTLSDGRKITATANTGYTFSGWSSTSGKIDAKKTIIATYRANTYTISYNGNGATGGSTASSSHTYNAAKTLTTNGFTRTGYTFAGWNTQANGSGTNYSDNQSVTNLSSTQGATVTLYALWTQVSHTLTVNPNGGTYAGSTSNKTYTQKYGTAVNVADPTRTGYTFGGWALTKEENNATWIEVMYHNPTVEGFGNEAGAKSKNTLNAYSQLGQLANMKYNNQYEFMLKADEATGYNRWIQTSNPVDTTTVTGYKAVQNSWNTSNFAGLVHCSGQTLIAWTTSTGNWWYAIGMYNKGTCPIINSSSLWTTKPIHYYVRAASDLSNIKTPITGALDSNKNMYIRDEDVTLKAVWIPNQLNFANQTITKTFSTGAQTAGITGAGNGTGSYAYTEKSEKNASGTATNYISISGTTINIAANTPAGTYTYVITAKDNNSKVTKDATYTIKIERAKTATAAAANKTYNGANQTGVTGSSVTWSGTTSAINAATYTATATPDGNHTWSDGTTAAKTITWKMNPKSVAVTWGTTTTFNYNGGAQAPTAAATSGVSGETINLTRTTAINAGSYTSTASISSVSGGRANKANYTLTGNTKAFKINKVNATMVNPTLATGLVYNTKAQSLLSKAGSASGGTIKYGLGANSTTAPTSWNTSVTGTNAGTYFVWSKVDADGNHNSVAAKYIGMVTIAKAKVTVPTSPVRTLTYNGATQAHGYTAPTGAAIETNGTTASTIDAGTYNIVLKITNTSNYQWSDNTTANKTVNWKINPKSVAVTWGTTTTFSYTGRVQAPTASAASGVSGETINVTRTSAINAGTYTSKASISSVTGGRAKAGNYTLTGNTKAFTINKVAATNPTLKTTTAKYDKNAHAITVSGGSGGTIYYRTSTDNKTWGSWSTTKPTRTSIGTTYVQAYVVGDGNHTNTSATGSATITITKPTAADVSYTPSDSSWKVENVKQALDALYNR